MSKVNVVVVGYGHLGKWHTQKAHTLENCNLVGIVEAFEANQLAAKETYPDVTIYSNIEDTFDIADAFVIVTPTSTHYDLVKVLLEKNKHVFCEKPLCETYDQVKSLESFLNTDKVLQVGHSERCHEAWEILKPELKKFQNSKVSVKINRFAAFKGRATDVDVVQDLMIHDLDLALFLFNKNIKSVKAWGHKIRTDKYDHVTALLSASDGSEIMITSGRNHVNEVRSVEVMSNDGCTFVDLFKNTISIGTNDVFENGEYVKESSYEKRDHLFIEQEAFYNSIINKTRPMVTYTDGRNAIEMIKFVMESLNSGEVIEL